MQFYKNGRKLLPWSLMIQKAFFIRVEEEKKFNNANSALVTTENMHKIHVFTEIFRLYYVKFLFHYR